MAEASGIRITIKHASTDRPGTRFSKVLDVHLTAPCLTVSADTVYDLFQHRRPAWVEDGSHRAHHHSGGALVAGGADHHAAYESASAGRRDRHRPSRLSAWWAGEKAMGISSP